VVARRPLDRLPPGEFPTSVLYVIGADGEGERRLTSAGEPATMPSWGPAR